MIAGVMGITRNAVVGKVYRLKLVAQVKKQAPLLLVPQPPSPLQMPRTSVNQLPKPMMLSMMKLGSRSCRYPYGNPQKKRFGFCGHETEIGKSYCLAHYKLAYKKLRPTDSTKPKFIAKGRLAAAM